MSSITPSDPESNFAFDLIVESDSSSRASESSFLSDMDERVSRSSQHSLEDYKDFRLDTSSPLLHRVSLHKPSNTFMRRMSTIIGLSPLQHATLREFQHTTVSVSTKTASPVVMLKAAGFCNRENLLTALEDVGFIDALRQSQSIGDELKRLPLTEQAQRQLCNLVQLGDSAEDPYSLEALSQALLAAAEDGGPLMKSMAHQLITIATTHKPASELLQALGTNSPYETNGELSLVRLCQDFAHIPGFLEVIEDLTGYDPKENAVVAKGGYETMREAFALQLTHTLGIDRFVMKKTEIHDMHISMTKDGVSEEFTSGLVMPFREGFGKDSLFSEYQNSLAESSPEKYKTLIDGVDAKISHESFSSLLYLSFLSGSTDDHHHQFNTEARPDGKVDLIHCDLGRNFSHTQLIQDKTPEGEPMTYCCLRTFLLDLPQLDQALDPLTLLQIDAMQGRMVDPSFQQNVVSEFAQPQELYELLQTMPKKRPKDAKNFLAQVRQYGGREAAKEVVAYWDSQQKRVFKTKPSLKNFPLMQRAKKGATLPLQQRIAECLARGDIKEANALRSHAISDRCRDQVIARQKAAYTCFLEKRKAMTGRDLAEAMYPDEMMFLKAAQQMYTNSSKSSLNCLGVICSTMKPPVSFESLTRDYIAYQSAHPDTPLDPSVQELTESLQRCQARAAPLGSYLEEFSPLDA